jgi:plastocyanin
MKKVVALLVLALAAIALVACGGDDEDETTTSGTTTEAPSEAGGAAGGGAAKEGGGGGGSVLKIAAVPDTGLEYTTDEATAEAGELTIEFENPQTLTHDVAIEDESGNQVGKTELIADSSTSADVGNVKPGKYTFYCTVPGHREGGMEGTLTVK